MAEPPIQLPPLPKDLPSRPPGIETKIYLIAASMTLLPMIAIALRFYSRNLKKTGLSWDDYMVLPAMILTTATAILIFIGVATGDLGKHTHSFQGYPIFTRQTQVFQKVEYATLITTVLTFGFTKLSVLLFYKRVFQGAIFSITCWIMVGLVFVWTVGFTFAQIFQCYPISTNWNAFGASPEQCIDVNRMMIAQAWSDVATNVVILLLPLGCIWKLQMPSWKKVGVCGVFFLGALIVGFGIAKIVVYYEVFTLFGRGEFDYTYFVLIQTPFVYWPMIESGVGIIGACLPLMRPLISGASSPGFMRNLRSFNGTTTDSDTFWEHSDNTALRGEWNNSIATTKFGSASQASTKFGDGISTEERGSDSSPKRPQGGISTMKWGTESLPPVDPNYHYPGYNSPRKGSTAVPMRQLLKSNLGVLDDDELDDYPIPPRNPRRERDMV